MTSYYRANHDARNPLVIYTKCWQVTRVLRTLKLPAENAYQVDYILEQHDNSHPLPALTTNWRATMRVVQGKPTKGNGLGLWVDSLDFSEEAR